MERDKVHDLTENQSSHARNTAMQRQAPASLLAALEQRIEQYDAARTRGGQVDELQHAQWEARCAAVERLGVSREHDALASLNDALADEHYLVRVTAIKALSQFGAQTPVMPLFNALQDSNWQVREMAVLTLGELEHVPITDLQAAEHDASRNVREAVALVKQQRLAPPEHMHDAVTLQERMPIQMKTVEEHSSTTEEKSASEQAVLLPQAPGKPHKLQMRWQKVIALVAAVLMLVVLTAAGANAGWWNTLFGGNAALYQTIDQPQTDQGITITVRRVYADEERTIIVYDMTVNPAVQLFVTRDTLSGSAPQKISTMQATSCSGTNNDVKHCYAILPAFLVGSGAQTLRLTWDIPRLLVGPHDPQALAGFHIETVHYGSGPGDMFVIGHWRFSFSVPFHHENRKDMPDPLT